jgi:hypothetical protein
MQIRRPYRLAIVLLVAIAALLAVGAKHFYPQYFACGSTAGEAVRAMCTAYEAALPLIGYIGQIGKFVDDHERTITAVFIIILALSTMSLWAATRDAARAGQRAAAVAERALTRLQQAFVFPKDFSPVGIVTNASGPAIRVRFKWHNSGATPARNVQSHVGWEHWQHDIPANFPFSDPGGGARPNSYVAPHADLPSAAVDIDLPIIEAARVGQIRLFLWGFVSYDDIFAGTPPHITKFCWEIQVRGDSAYATNARLELSTTTHDRHNCIDEDCL